MKNSNGKIRKISFDFGNLNTDAKDVFWKNSLCANIPLPTQESILACILSKT
jgi:hypothetical protein